MDKCEIVFKRGDELLEFLETVNTYMYTIEDSTYNLIDVMEKLDKTIPTLNRKTKVDADVLRAQMCDAIEKMQIVANELREFTDKLGFEQDNFWI
jgi:hypothetical protein